MLGRARYRWHATVARPGSGGMACSAGSPLSPEPVSTDLDVIPQGERAAAAGHAAGPRALGVVEASQPSAPSATFSAGRVVAARQSAQRLVRRLCPEGAEGSR